MKHINLALLLLFLSGHFLSIGQGLNFEKGFNDAYFQIPQTMVCDDLYSYFVYYESFEGHLLTKLDTLGNEEWTQNVIRPGGGYVESIVLAEDTAIYVSGYVSACDVFDSYDFITKISTSGHIIWNRIWKDDQYYGNWSFNHHSSGFSILSNGNIARQRSDDSAHLYIINQNGNRIDSLTFLETQFQGFAEFGSNYLAYNENKIWEIIPNAPSSGSVEDRKTFTSNIQQLIPFNNKYYVLTENTLHELDSTLNIITSVAYDANQHVSNLKVSDDMIQYLVADSTKQTIFTFNHQMELIDSFSLLMPRQEEAVQDYSTTHFSRAIAFDLTQYKSIRFLDYSLNDNLDAPVFSTDVELTDINILDYEISPSNWLPNVYNVSTQVEVLIKNNGVNTLQSKRLNRILDIADVCNAGIYSIVLKDLNLAPGDSTWITLSRDASRLYIPSELVGDSISFSLCFYSSHPNGQTDLNVANDEVCRDFSVQYVSNNNLSKSDISIHPNPAQDFVEISSLPLDVYHYRIFDVHGRAMLISKLRSNIIDISELSFGTYYLHIANQDGSVRASSLFVKY